MPGGRRCKYETHVKPKLKEIEKMCLSMTEKQMAAKLGVAYSTWNEYKKLYPELTETLKKGRDALVLDLKSYLIKKAKGFTYTEKKIIKEGGQVVREEIYEKTALPDVAALNLLLKNYDRDNWANDPQTLDLRRKELELQKKKLETEQW